jgi:drug/metabolite transporter (DMT)-like permease
MIPNRRRGIAWSLGAALASGLFVIPWKLANEVGAPSTSAFALLAWAALFNSLLGLFQLRGRKPIPLTRYETWTALALGVLSLLGNLASASGIAILSPSLFNVLQRSEVLVVPVLAWALIGERVERRFWLGASIAVGGLAVMNDPFGEASIDARGASFAFASVLCFSAMGVVTRMAITRVDPVRLNALRLWMTLPLWWVLTGGAVDLGSVGAAQLGYTALAAFAGPFAARLCLIFSARHVAARTTALGALSAPAVSVPFEWLLLAHVPPRQQLLGGAILLAGIAVPLLRRRAT